jgi:prolyl-tRNA synthetase
LYFAFCADFVILQLLRLQDRHKGWYCIAPTAEEPITALVASEVSSPRQLPLRLYQIGKKYRDEMRPRFGLLRSREFIMKDLYTFDSTQEQAFATYDAVSDAYFRIFRRMAFDVVRCEADSGNIGGNRSHEFHVVTPTGFDDLLRCSQCDYAANVEKAASRITSAGQSASLHPNADVHAAMVKVYQAAQQAAKGFTLAVPETLSCHVVVPVGAPETKSTDSKATANRIALVFTPQGRLAQPLALKDALGSWGELRVVDDAEQVKTLLTAADVTKLKAFIDVNTVAPTEAKSNFIGHFALSAAGDQCPRCSGSLQASKGVEVGHVFYLGQKYSKLLAANIVTAEQKKQPIEMGCFGIGVTRILAAAVEAAGGHDANGIRWPEAIAPYRAVLISAGSPQQDEQCLKLYAELMRRVPSMRGELVLDDRNFAEHRFGSKLKDAQLVGFPWIVIGGKSLEVDGKFEVQHRASGEKRMLTVADIVTLFGGQ